MRPLLGTKPVKSIVLDAAVSNIATGTWTEVSTALNMGVAGAAVEIFNSTGSTLAFSNGTAGNEAAALLPYTILQGGTGAIIPFEIKNGRRLSVKALDIASSAGILVLNIFG